MSSNFSAVRPAGPKATDQLHPWIRALDAFDVPFLCYDGAARRTYMSSSARDLVRSEPHGVTIAERADRLVSDELHRAAPRLQIGTFALARILSYGAAAVRLTLHVARSADYDVRAVVIVQPEHRLASDGSPGARLTPREMDVARLITLGLATKVIAHRLGISTHTARHHTERVFAKLGVRNRAGVAALMAGRMGVSSHGRDAGPQAL